MNSNCGVPTTVTGSLNSTVAVISSPARKTPNAPCARPDSVTPATVGGTPSAADPFTSKAASSVIAWSPRPSAALLAASSRIVPPFRSSEETPIPFGSRSPRATA